MFLKRLLTVILLGASLVTGYGQAEGDWMVAAHFDLVKTDFTKPLEKVQSAIEAHYFVRQNFTVHTGLEVWTQDELSFLVGARWYPREEVFVRLRGLIGANDVTLGGGFTKPVAGNLKFEAIADFYFSIDFAIRAGFIYMMHKNP